jgi:uncharacterized protein YecE (DUF72 family)
MEIARRPAGCGTIEKMGAEKKSGLYVGTSGWAYASWKPGFYPKAVPAKKFLEHYATRLNSVEVNYTFRKLPTAAMVGNWLAATEKNFKFSFKAPQRITHILRLRDAAKDFADLLMALGVVVDAGKMGLVLLQFPPNFRAEAKGKDGELNRVALEKFLMANAGVAKTAGVRLAVEFRDASWFSEPVYVTLREHNVALCAAESEGLETPEVATADFAAYRLRKPEYDAGELSAVVKKLKKASERGDVFAYFKHEEEPGGALNAERVLEKLAK